MFIDNCFYQRIRRNFYKILYTGPIETTTLSFTSSNSSFSECVRNSHSRLFHLHSLYLNELCSQPSISDQNFIKQKCSDALNSHSFIHCSWDNTALASKGGAIHFVLTDGTKQPSASLTVDKCTFLHCHETDNDGSAVHARYIGTASVSDSFFYDCKCGSNPGQEGAGVCFVYLSRKPSITRCSFVSGVSADDAGGCSIWYSSSSVAYAIDSVRCINCKGTSQSSSEGGGIYLYKNDNFMTCTNSLFTDCNSQLRLNPDKRTSPNFSKFVQISGNVR